MPAEQARQSADEQARLKALEGYDLLDTLPESSFDRIVALAARICDTPIALFTLVDRNRQWFKSRIGISVEETSRDVSFCAQAVAADATLIVEDTMKDERFVKNPLVVGDPYIRFYAGVPVHAEDSHCLGALCVIDREPRALSDHQRYALQALARELEGQLVLRQTLKDQQGLIDERAILTHMVLHDAAGTLAALRWNIDQLRDRVKGAKDLLDPMDDTIESLMRSCASVGDINAAQSRGIKVNLEPWDLNACLNAITRRASGQAKRAGVTVALDNSLPEKPVTTDAHLLERVIVNLVNNAVDACAAGATIDIVGRVNETGAIELRVEDDGPGIEPAVAQRMFEPYFSRRSRGPVGSGLGLAFCKLAAELLGGSIAYAPRAPHGAVFTIEIANA